MRGYTRRIDTGRALQDKANQRKQDLDDSLQAQQYFADANEGESWMHEKEPLVVNTDYGRDEDSAEVSGHSSLNVYERVREQAL